MSNDIAISQTIRGGRFIDTADKTITVATTRDFVADYGDNELRARLEVPIGGVLLREGDVDELIRNLQTVKRGLR